MTECCAVAKAFEIAKTGMQMGYPDPHLVLEESDRDVSLSASDNYMLSIIHI